MLFILSTSVLILFLTKSTLYNPQTLSKPILFGIIILMAVYKVPQDVEAEDKLLGPFSFRQFIYLVIAVLAGGLAYFLGTIFIGLALIPLPLIVIFLILALPLKKDQPMEVYAAAILAFYLKPHLKLWEPDGILNMVEFTNDGLGDQEFSPDITFDEARQRISFLSNLVDSNGELIRSSLVANPAIQSDIAAEATQVEDMHDDNAVINQKFDAMINNYNQTRREQIIGNLSDSEGFSNNQASQPANFPLPPEPVATPTPQPTQFSPTPTPPATPPDQSSVSSTAEQTFPQQTPEPTDNSYVFNPSPDIINLANNNDLSVQTLSAEAKKIADRNKKLLGEEEEVIISLR